MKRKHSIILSCCITALLLCLLLSSLNRVMKLKTSDIQFDAFYQAEENFDVLFLGTSHVMNGISPMDLWEQNGIVSYNLATPGCRIATSYWTLKSALDYTKPKVVVLDCAYLLDDKINTNINYSHRLFDAMPLTRTKLEALNDLVGSRSTRLSFLFPFFIYHSRWDELTMSDFDSDTYYGTMGFSGQVTVEPTMLPYFSLQSSAEISNVSTEYLQKIIQLCETQDISLVLTFLPFNASKTSQNDAAYVAETAQEYQLDFIDPNLLSEIINPDVDFANNYEDNAHINLSGAHKFSYFIGNYLTSHYNLPDHREDPTYASWNEYDAIYRETKQQYLIAQTYASSYFMLLADRDFDIVLSGLDSSLWDNPTYAALLNNLGMDSEQISEDTKTVVISGTDRTVEYFHTACSAGASFDTVIGSISIQPGEDAENMLLLDSNEICSLAALDEPSEFTVVVIDHSTKTFVDQVSFCKTSADIRVMRN